MTGEAWKRFFREIPTNKGNTRLLFLGGGKFHMPVTYFGIGYVTKSMARLYAVKYNST